MPKSAPSFLENLDAFVASREKTTVSDSGKYTSKSGVMAKVAAEVVKANFPHLMEGLTNPVDSKTTEARNLGEYFTLSGRIAFAEPALRAAIYPEQQTSSEGKTTINFTTAEVMDTAKLMLHEAYHARSRGGLRSTVQDAIKAAPLSEEEQKKINRLQSDSFFSVNPAYLDVEEFLANADSLLNLKEIGAVVPGTLTARQSEMLQAIFELVPQSKKLVEGARRPEIPSMKGTPPTVLEQLQNLLTQAIKP